MLQKQVVSLELLNLLNELQSVSLLKEHYLAGGTSLALQLGHRKSTDIDLFANKKQDNGSILNILKDKYKNYDILNITNNGIQLMINNIKVDMIGMRQNILEDIKSEDGINYYGKYDIAAMKLRAIIYRNKFRDYVDIAYLMKDISFKRMIDCYKKKYNEDNITLLKMKIVNGQFDNIEIKEVENCMIRDDIDLNRIPLLIKNEIRKYNEDNNINVNIFTKIFSNNKKEEIIEYINHITLTNEYFNNKMTGNKLKVMRNYIVNNNNEKYIITKSKYTNNQNQTTYILERRNDGNNCFTVDVWQFARNFNKKQALQFVQNWDKT